MKLYIKLYTKLLYKASVVKPSYTEPSHAELSYEEPSSQSRCVEPPYVELYAELRVEPKQAKRESPVRRRFLLDIVEAYGVDILINYRAASADQFSGISEIIAVVGVQINFVEKGDCSIYKISCVA